MSFKKLNEFDPKIFCMSKLIEDEVIIPLTKNSELNEIF